MASVIYRRNRERMSFPILQSDFVQGSAGTSYRQFSNFCTSMVKSKNWMLQMKLQLGIKVFHHSKISPASFKVIWWVFDCSWSSYDLGNCSAVDFHGRSILTSWIRFGPQYRFCDDSNIRFQGNICIILISDFLSHWWPAVEWRSVSATRLKILVGHMSTRDHSSTDFFSYLSPSSAHCKGSNFFENFEGLWYQFSQCPSCYEHHNVFLLRYSYYTVILCVFSEFEFTDVVFVQGINTKSFKFS